MNSIVDWLSLRWRDVAVPVAVFFAALVAAFWLRRAAIEAFDRWANKTRWQGREILANATKGPSTLWCLILSVYVGLAVSVLSEGWKDIAGRGLWTLFLLSLTLSALRLTGGLVVFYSEKLKAPQRAVRLARNVLRVTILVFATLMLLDVWGVPTSPFLLLIAVAVLAAALVLRNAIPNWAAWFQLAATGHVKVGDYVKLETGEEGYVKQIGWGNTQIKAMDESLILIPNRRLVESTVVNYGRPLRKAKDGFHFYTRVHLTELTGLKARNLKELAEIMKAASDSVIYFHTHHFLEQHHYLSPEPANDFAVWVSDVLGEEALGERLASVDTFEFPTLGALKERLVNVIEEHLAREKSLREASEGREFHFMKSVSAILPTPYVAHDLREFVEGLRKLSLGSVYFHVFESRLRLGRGLNDFSIWLHDSLEEPELAEQVARLDPYTYTLEGLRSTLIQSIEKRIK